MLNVISVISANHPDNFPAYSIRLSSIRQAHCISIHLQTTSHNLEKDLMPLVLRFPGTESPYPQNMKQFFLAPILYTLFSCFDICMNCRPLSNHHRLSHNTTSSLCSCIGLSLLQREHASLPARDRVMDTIKKWEGSLLICLFDL